MSTCSTSRLVKIATFSVTLGMAVARTTSIGLAADPTPLPSRTPDAFHRHFKLSAAPSASLSVSGGDGASLLQPKNSAVGITYGLQYSNKIADYQSLTVNYSHSFANDVGSNVFGTLRNAFNLESINAQSDSLAIQLTCNTAAKGPENDATRFTVGLSETYHHAGPSLVKQAGFPSNGAYHVLTVTPDYFFGPVYVQGVGADAGNTRRWDIAVSASRGTHRTTSDPMTGASDSAAKVTVGFSPTYTFPLGHNGLLFGAINYTNDARYFDGLTKPVHFNDYDISAQYTPNEHWAYEIHLNSLTSSNPAAVVLVPGSVQHANIDVKITLKGVPWPNP